MLTITEIEDLLISRIKDRLPYLAEVASYQGQLEKEIAELVLRTPAVLVSLQALPGETASFAEYVLNYTFSLSVVCRDLRGEAAGRRGGAGAYRILDDLYAALHDYALDAQLSPLAYNQAEALLITKEVVIYAAAYTVTQED